MKLAPLLVLTVLLAACHAEPQPAKKGCGTDARYQRTSVKLHEGRELLAAGNAAAADRVIEGALTDLGRHYSSMDVIDDTGLWLSGLRGHQRQEGLAPWIVDGKARMLESRLSQYRDSAGPEGCRPA